MAARPELQMTEVTAWFAGRLPNSWFIAPIAVHADRDEIVVTGELAPPSGPEGTDARAQSVQACIEGFREGTRLERMRIAEIAQQRFGRHVTWAARCGDYEALFTQASVPVMTRLRFAEREVLDTLIDVGVARSRSEALAWCVQQVGQHQAEWIAELRDAMAEVERIRRRGPS